MGILSHTKRAANRLLRFANLRIDSLTAERTEMERLRELQAAGHFDQPIFPVLEQFKLCDPLPIFDQIRRDERAFAQVVANGNITAFPLSNSYYTTPDAEVLYSIVQLYQPARIIEIGSGYSTQLFRAAISHSGATTRLTSIDPYPRQDIQHYSDCVIKEPIEKIAPDLFDTLTSSDIVFIDSSHEVKAGNDVLHLFTKVLPRLQPGVLIHIHDIFLPFEYPKQWLVDLGWHFFKEQYLVQMMLACDLRFEVIWPGYYLQRTMSDFATHFRQWRNVDALSLWVRCR
jgi:predicted O-methyltransferase YrrM